jgi:hypothetical protein
LVIEALQDTLLVDEVTRVYFGYVLVVNSQVILQVLSKGLKDVHILIEFFPSLNGESFLNIAKILIKVVNLCFLLLDFLFLRLDKLSQYMQRYSLFEHSWLLLILILALILL